jgi:hypothetical protein
VVQAGVTRKGLSFWALTIIAVDVVALYGLCAYGIRRNLEAV